MTSLRAQAIAAYKAIQSDRATEARTALAAVLAPFDATPLTVADIAVTDTSTLVVFTDGDIHLGVRALDDGWDVHMVEPAGSGVVGWREVGPQITELPQLGKVLPTFDPTDENATPAVPAWAYPVAYKVDDRVTYGGSTWKANQAHTSQAAWYPGATGVYLWTKVA